MQDNLPGHTFVCFVMAASVRLLPHTCVARLSIAVTTAMQFNGLYEAAIDGAERPSLPAKRIAAIIDHMTFEIYKYIQRGLFERHKLIFAWMLTASILVSAGKVRSPRAHTLHCFQILSAGILGTLNITHVWAVPLLQDISLQKCTSCGGSNPARLWHR